MHTHNKKKYIVTIVVIIVVAIVSVNTIWGNDADQSEYEQTMDKIARLESLADNYARDGKTHLNAKKLACIYMRCKRYNSFSWQWCAGCMDERFEKYVKEADPDLESLKDVGDIALPDGEKTDFIHMIAAINMFQSNDGITGSWGGDLCQLIKQIKEETGSIEYLMECASNLFNKMEGSYFGHYDLIADLDAANIYSKYTKENTSLYNAMRGYFKNTDSKSRIRDFVDTQYGVDDLTKENLRMAVKEKFYGEQDVRNLLSSYKVYGTAYEDHRTACLQVFSDFLFDSYEPLKPTETPTEISATETPAVETPLYETPVTDLPLDSIETEVPPVVSPGTSFFTEAPITSSPVYTTDPVMDIKENTPCPTEIPTMLPSTESPATALPEKSPSNALFSKEPVIASPVVASEVPIKTETPTETPSDNGVLASTVPSITGLILNNGIVDKIGDHAVELIDNMRKNANANMNIKTRLALSAKRGKIVIKWKKVKGAKGYQIKYSTNKNFKGSKIINKGKKTKKNIMRKIKKEKKYYFKIRYYIINSKGKKRYSRWSKIKAIKAIT